MRYPKAIWLPRSPSGGSYVGGSPRGVLHTTETHNWAGAKYYHIEYNPNAAPGKKWRQYRLFERSAYGLRHPSSTPQTNRQGTACIQVAVTGYAGNSHNWGDEVYADLAEFIAWSNENFGIKPWSRYDVGHNGSAYGEKGTARMLWDEWLEHDGWCAHQEVPSNSHWDAGKVDWTRLLGDGMTPEQRASLDWLEEMRPWLDSFIYSTTEGVDQKDPNGGQSSPFFPEVLIPYHRNERKELEARVAALENSSNGVGELEVTTETIEVVTNVTIVP